MLPELIVRFSINNQISLGLQNVYRKPKDIFDCDYRIKDKYEIARKIYERKFEQEDATECESFEQKLDRIYPPLDIKKKFQRSKKADRVVSGFSRLGNGSRENLERIPPFGAKQGQKLRESGAAIDNLIAHQGGGARIITLTLPGDTKEAFECLAANSGYLINRLFQGIRRDYKDCKNWFFVWEYQKRGALHLHICLWHKEKNSAARCGVLLVRAWYKILEDIQSQSGIDMFVRKDEKTYTPKRKWQSRNEPMRKSAGGYFSKYASKASDKKERQKIYHLAKKYPPSRFWGSSHALKKIIKSESFDFNYENSKAEYSERFYEGIRAIINEFNILSIGNYEWKLEKEYYSHSLESQGKRVITEGFKQNYYFSPDDFLAVKIKILAYIDSHLY
jgi:hypothetical protein